MLELIKFEVCHLDDLKKWSYHQDIRFEHYDFKYFKDKDYLRWYNRKQRPFSQHLFATLKDKTLIGFITMKKINWFKKEATMGIVFNPAEVSKGYGTRAIALFLKMFFNVYKFKRLKLKVADFNRRAMNSYAKNGFCIIQSKMEPYEVQSKAFDILLEDKGAFYIKDGILMTLVHEMHIDINMYNDYLRSSKNKRS